MQLADQQVRKSPMTKEEGFQPEGPPARPPTCAGGQRLGGLERLLQALLPVHKASDLLGQQPLRSVGHIARGLQHNRCPARGAMMRGEGRLMMYEEGEVRYEGGWVREVG